MGNRFVVASSVAQGRALSRTTRSLPKAAWTPVSKEYKQFPEVSQARQGTLPVNIGPVEQNRVYPRSLSAHHIPARVISNEDTLIGSSA